MSRSTRPKPNRKHKAARAIAEVQTAYNSALEIKVPVNNAKCDFLFDPLRVILLELERENLPPEKFLDSPIFDNPASLQLFINGFIKYKSTAKRPLQAQGPNGSYTTTPQDTAASPSPVKNQRLPILADRHVSKIPDIDLQGEYIDRLADSICFDLSTYHILTRTLPVPLSPWESSAQTNASIAVTQTSFDEYVISFPGVFDFLVSKLPVTTHHSWPGFIATHQIAVDYDHALAYCLEEFDRHCYKSSVFKLNKDVVAARNLIYEICNCWALEGPISPAAEIAFTSSLTLKELFLRFWHRLVDYPYTIGHQRMHCLAILGLIAAFYSASSKYTSLKEFESWFAELPLPPEYKAKHLVLQDSIIMAAIYTPVMAPERIFMRGWIFNLPVSTRLASLDANNLRPYFIAMQVTNHYLSELKRI
ncbi:hypothetical protein DSO57_1007256 [Entomophthora muscae]|uniref:Uncharacterized protein n=1 Tax=Entomophthora muscae TaxID=34485 RepID=A0ACC2UI15_9FUNG|nr:hypothetical protein DSO57_1007256 [Entomophthora muscae]